MPSWLISHTPHGASHPYCLPCFDTEPGTVAMVISPDNPLLFWGCLNELLKLFCLCFILWSSCFCLSKVWEYTCALSHHSQSGLWKKEWFLLWRKCLVASLFFLNLLLHTLPTLFSLNFSKSVIYQQHKQQSSSSVVVIQPLLSERLRQEYNLCSAWPT